MEGGIDALAFASGMAAIGTCFELFKSGDHIIVTDDLYGGTIRIFEHMDCKFHILILLLFLILKKKFKRIQWRYMWKHPPIL